MLAPDSLVLDLIFAANAELDKDKLSEVLGEDYVSNRTLLDPDMLDPRFEMETSPSIPFRRRGERRILIIDPASAPLRPNIETNPVCEVDLRLEKERLIGFCDALDVRAGRMFALGMPGDAVIVVREAKDLRGLCLLHWALDPMTDLSGRRRASRLSQAEFEEKLVTFDKRLEELDEASIIERTAPAKFERRGDLMVVDCLDGEGKWDVRVSLAMMQSLAAMETFSTIPGAPSAAGKGTAAPAKDEKAAARGGDDKPAATAEPVADEPVGPPLETLDIGGRLVLQFFGERFDRDIAAAVGKADWESVVRSADKLSGQQIDTLHRDGGGFVAPLEFLSEVLVEGKPLSKPDFDRDATQVSAGVRSLEVLIPRFGPGILLEIEGRGRFISSERDAAEALVAALGA